MKFILTLCLIMMAMPGIYFFGKMQGREDGLGSRPAHVPVAGDLYVEHNVFSHDGYQSAWLMRATTNDGDMVYFDFKVLDLTNLIYPCYSTVQSCESNFTYVQPFNLP